MSRTDITWQQCDENIPNDTGIVYGRGMENTIKTQIGVRLPGPDRAIVEALATAERRSLSGMIAVLVSEAISRREAELLEVSNLRAFVPQVNP